MFNFTCLPLNDSTTPDKDSYEEEEKTQGQFSWLNLNWKSEIRYKL